MLRFSNHLVQSPDDFFDLLVLLDTDHVARFSAEVPLNEKSVVIIGKDQASTPAFVSESGARIVELPLDSVASETASGGENIVATGLLAELLGLEKTTIQTVLREHLAAKEALLAQAEDWLLSGWLLAEKYEEIADIKLTDNAGERTSMVG